MTTIFWLAVDIVTTLAVAALTVAALIWVVSAINESVAHEKPIEETPPVMDEGAEVPQPTPREAAYRHMMAAQIGTRSPGVAVFGEAGPSDQAHEALE